MDNPVPAAHPVEPTEPFDPSAWQPLPPRSRNLFLIGTMPLASAAGLGAGVVCALAMDPSTAGMVATAASGLLLGAAFGLWLGLKQYRHTFWRLDDDGLAVRRGRLWQRETRVPASRVQHLDLKHGPLQRGRALATLVVHTAGTRLGAVTVPNLDATDAERLRDRLGRQIDHDDDD